MAKILVRSPDGPYSAELDTGVMSVTVLENFVGMTFITNDGEMLSVVMRDTGYELVYADALDGQKVNIEAKAGVVKHG